MFRRICTLILLAISSACASDATAVVARVFPARSSVGDAGGGDSGATDAGPADAGAATLDAGPVGPWPASLTWALYWETNGLAEWGSDPTATSATVIARSPPNVRAGLAFEFGGGVVLDLAQYDQAELTVDVTEGDAFELFLGRGPDVGCSYVFVRGQQNTYTTNLSSPAWCVPTQCGFDLKVTGGMVLAYVPKDSRLAATVTGLRFFSSSPGARSGSASALGGAKGPGGFCWFLVDWDKTGGAAWSFTNPTSSSVHVRATTTTSSIVGMAFEIPQGFRLSQYQAMVVDATVSNGLSSGTSAFLVQAVKLTQGRGWVRQGDGSRQTYRVELTAPSYTFGGGTLNLDDVSRIEFVPQASGGISSIDALVQSVQFIP